MLHGSGARAMAFERRADERLARPDRPRRKRRAGEKFHVVGAMI